MKKILTAAVAMLGFSSVFAQAPVNPNATPEARELLQFIYNQSGHGLLAGQHSYPLYSDIYMERAYHQSGEVGHPAVFGQDFGYSKPGSLDGINNRQRVVDNAIKWHDKGAIITLMWHAVPPTTDANYTTWKGENGIQSKLTDAQWGELLKPGTAINLRWQAQVDVIAFFLKQLQDQNIPVIWRPYHEMNGDWFWWGYKPGHYQKLFRMLYDRLTNYHHLNNLLWVFNANEIGSSNVMDYDKFYPGKDVVDILATDVYSKNYEKGDYEALLKLADGKPVAWGECGQIPTPEIAKKQPKMVWFMTWCEFLETDNTWESRSAIYNYSITLEKLNAMRAKKN